MKIRVISILLAAFSVACCAADEDAVQTVAGLAKQPPKLVLEASAGEVLAACRDMIPARPVELRGAIVLRNRRGIVSKEYGYMLTMRREPDISIMTVRLTPRDGTNVIATVTVSRRPGMRADMRLIRDGGEESPALTANVMGTDVTWLDLTFDFLWWSNASYEADREGESVHGQKCMVILVRPDVAMPGVEAVRLWVDKKTGCLMQAEELAEGLKPIRRMWGTRVKKFDDRWMVSVLEVETLGSRHRTKITVESLRDIAD